jgi:hypothetical protein
VNDTAPLDTSNDNASGMLVQDTEEPHHSDESAGSMPENGKLRDSRSFSVHSNSSGFMESIETPISPTEVSSALQAEATSQLVPLKRPSAVRRFLFQKAQPT